MSSTPANRPKADILIVDDTPDNIRFLSAMLNSHGYDVRKALSGQTALLAVQTLLPDLILLDVNMPEMNGYEVCKRLKEDERTRFIPVIFLSALDDVLDKVRGFQAGAADYITKPFQFEEVLVRIQTQLTIQGLQGQLQAQNTQLQEALSDLKKAQTQLVQKEKMIGLGQLVAGIAHEINNPIGFISGNLAPARKYIQDLLNLTQLYQKEYPNPSSSIQTVIDAIDISFLIADLPKIMDSMQTGVNRIHTVLLALRIFSRLDESDIKAVDLQDGIESTLLLLQYRLNPKEHRPEIQVIRKYGDLPLVTCYASQVNQVFLNLLNNAIDALDKLFDSSQTLATNKSLSEDDSEYQTIPTIWITTESTAANTVIIQVKDNGIGIAEDLRSRIFNPFFTTKAVGEGMGLGLSTSYQIVVEKHKGRLTYVSQPGVGTEFTVEIPVELNNPA